MLQLPVLLLLNGSLAFYHWRQGLARKGNWSRRFGPLCLHVIGACSVLIMPISVIFTVDLKYGFDWGPVPVPPITQGGFEHHGRVIAFFEIIGVLCIMVAGIWGANVHETLSRLLADASKQGAAS